MFVYRCGASSDRRFLRAFSCPRGLGVAPQMRGRLRSRPPSPRLGRSPDTSLRSRTSGSPSEDNLGLLVPDPGEVEHVVGSRGIGFGGRPVRRHHLVQPSPVEERVRLTGAIVEPGVQQRGRGFRRSRRATRSSSRSACPSAAPILPVIVGWPSILTLTSTPGTCRARRCAGHAREVRDLMRLIVSCGLSARYGMVWTISPGTTAHSGR